MKIVFLNLVINCTEFFTGRYDNQTEGYKSQSHRVLKDKGKKRNKQLPNDIRRFVESVQNTSDVREVKEMF